MATYKVPQDVEADDKLIGFLSLKQFIFVILGLGSGYLTFFFATKIHILASIPFVPFTAAFLILGLYQRSDQPVEIYLASAIRFHLKPHTRIWDQEGYEERVIITAPPKIEKNYTKGYSQDQVSSHLGNLSRLMDTRGWASKLASDWQNPVLGAAASSDRLVQPEEVATLNDSFGRVQPLDVQDEDTSLVAREFEARIQQADSQTHQNAMRTLEKARQDTTASPDQPAVAYTQYPAMHQKTVQPPTPSDTATEQTVTAQTTPAANSQANPDGTIAQQGSALADQPIAPASQADTGTVSGGAPAPQTADDTESTAVDDEEVEIKLH